MKTPLAILCIAAAIMAGKASGQRQEIPEILEPWRGWVTWDIDDLDCPPVYNNAGEKVCLWPSRLSLVAGAQGGSWTVRVVAFSETWMALPGGKDLWPTAVSADGTPLVVVERANRPAVKLSAGTHQLSGSFTWDEMPQRIAVPGEIGILSLQLEGAEVEFPNWDADGHVWLKRLRTEPAEKNLLAAQVFRVIEDGIPLWLHTEMELTVSGKSREEELGWVLPEGWQLATVESPLPVAVDDQGRMKVQVRPGKWTIALHAFRPTDESSIKFSDTAQPVIDRELVGFRANPEFRLAELTGVKAVDVTQTTFPEKWRDLPVYQWDTATAIGLDEKIRGMGTQRPEGLRNERLFWLDEDGRSLTYRDTVTGRMQQIWRLDTANGQHLGAVRVDGTGQLITANPTSGAHGVEIRKRNLNLQAIGRVESTRRIPATGWQSEVDSLQATLNLPPGWRMFALFGADEVDGDWLTAWSLLDLFLLLIFSIAIFRLWGLQAGLVAFLAFGLAYHEPGAPRLTWLFLVIPVGLLRVVQEGAAQKWIKAWKYVAVALLAIGLVPFLAAQIQTTLYPQLESPGTKFQPRSMFRTLGFAYQESAGAVQAWQRTADLEVQQVAEPAAPQKRAKFETSNLLYDPKVRIQTGPAEPDWNWNRVRCRWDGPVSADQEIKPLLVSRTMNRLITVLRIALLTVLALVVFGANRFPGLPIGAKSGATAALVLLSLCLSPVSSEAQAIPDAQMLEELRQRLLAPDDAFPRAAEIAAVDLKLSGNRVTMGAEVHAATEAAVPLPGKLPTWSPLSVTVDGEATDLICRKDGYLWLVLPEGVHQVVVESLQPDVSEWEWTFLLAPRRVSIDAPGWTVTGVRPNGVPERQVFFARERPADESEVAYDRKDFNAVVAIDRHLETGLVWQVRNVVTRLSQPGKAVSLKVPLLAGESVLTSNMVVENGIVEVALGATQEKFSWISELPVGGEIQLSSIDSGEWVERWHLVTSAVWNMTSSGLAPVFAAQEEHLVPTWFPWPGEQVVLTFNKPAAVTGDTVTVQRVRHDTSLGSRQRSSSLKIDLECSLGSDFVVALDPDADVTLVSVGGQTIPVRRDGTDLIVPVQPGKQTVELGWRSGRPMGAVVEVDHVRLPVDGANVTSVLQVPESRWVLWSSGPTRGPAVRFWVILTAAVLVAVVLGRLKWSPLRRREWVLLNIGLTQVHISAAMIVVAWLFLLAWRGRRDLGAARRWRFNLGQLGLVLLTLISLGILLVVVGAGLLGHPDMFIIGNGSSRTYLQWFQPRATTELPSPVIVSVSVWFYRLLMLLWALWLASALLRWLGDGWRHFSHGGTWMKKVKVPKLPEPGSEALS